MPPVPQSEAAVRRVGRGLGFASVLASLLGSGVAVQEPAQAQAPAVRWMTREAVQTAIVGPPVEGVYPDGRAWSETMAADGTTQLNEAGVLNSGRWQFDGDELLCFRYDGLQTTGGCFRYVAIGTNCYEHFFQMRPGDPAAGWLSNGRLWRTAEPSTCSEKPTS